MAISFIRTIIMFGFVTLVLRVMGKRQIGELQPLELVVTIIISELAAIPIQDSAQPLMVSFISISTLLILEITLSFITFKSSKFRTVLFGKPSMFVEKGKMNQKEMEKQRVSVSDILEAMRNMGVASLTEVEYITMETNGQMSVILNAENRPLTPKDMSISPPPVELSYVVIDAGSINTHNLKRLGFDGEWLKKQLRSHNLNSPKDVFYMGANKSQEVFLIPNDEGAAS